LNTSILSLLILLFISNFARAESALYGKLTLGLNFLGDQSFKQSGIATAGSDGTSEHDSGWLAGGALGYRWTDNWAIELAWDYRTNDVSRTKFTDGSSFNKGDYASNIFLLNTFYRWTKSSWRPYAGAGLGWVQEIDIDLQNSGSAGTSYESANEVALQFVAGFERPIAQSWDLTLEARYMTVSGINLKQESGLARIKNIDYDPITLTLGAQYNF
jgi:outer membrane protein W